MLYTRNCFCVFRSNRRYTWNISTVQFLKKYLKEKYPLII